MCAMHKPADVRRLITCGTQLRTRFHEMARSTNDFCWERPIAGFVVGAAVTSVGLVLSLEIGAWVALSWLVR
jgi:ElaB/YqjD/DUF883 family membrane-anchored ribosome-binding protein